MSDITKCTNMVCKKQFSCLRKMALDNPYNQSYAEHECNEKNGYQFYFKANNVEDEMTDKEMWQYINHAVTGD